MSATVLPGLLAILLGAAVALGAFVPVVATAYRRHGGLSPLRLLGWIALCVYVIAIWAYTLVPIPSSPDYACSGVQLNLLEVFADIGRYDTSGPIALLGNPAVQQLAFNVVLFMPLGFLVRSMFGRGIVVATAAGLGISLLVEFTQLTGVWGLYPCAYRLFDVSDLLTNTVGAVLGSLAAWPFVHAHRRRDRVAPTVTAWRRLLGMTSDVVVLFLVGSALAIAWRLAVAAIAGADAADGFPVIDALLADWVPLALHLVVILATGATIGEHVVLLRPVNPALPPPTTRLLRFAGGIGAYGVLIAVGAEPLALLFAGASVVLVFTTRGHRGLAGVVSRTDVTVAEPNPAPAPAPVS